MAAKGLGQTGLRRPTSSSSTPPRAPCNLALPPMPSSSAQRAAVLPQVNVMYGGVPDASDPLHEDMAVEPRSCS